MPQMFKTVGVFVGVMVVYLLSALNPPIALADGGNDYVAEILSATDVKSRPSTQKTPQKILRVAQSAVEGWVVSQVSGSVRRADGNRAVTVGERLATGDRLVTGPAGQAKLVRRNDKITVSPNSDLKVGENKGDSLFTNIIQSIGTLLFQVEKNPRQRFQVVTPYLAATVKGTTFTVSVRAEGAAVHVTDGAVQVASRGGQSIVIVRPGQTGSVSSTPGAEVEIRKREGKSKPPASDNAVSEGTEQAKNETEKASGKGAGEINRAAQATESAKGPKTDKTNKGLARAIGTQPTNFAKLTKGFINNAGGLGSRPDSAGSKSKGKGKNGTDVVFRDASPSNSHGGNGNNGNGHGSSNASRSVLATVALARSNVSSGRSNSAGGNSSANSNAGSSSSSNSNAGSSNSANSNAGGNSSSNSNAGSSSSSNSNAGGNSSSNSNAGSSSSSNSSAGSSSSNSNAGSSGSSNSNAGGSSNSNSSSSSNGNSGNSNSENGNSNSGNGNGNSGNGNSNGIGKKT